MRKGNIVMFVQMFCNILATIFIGLGTDVVKDGGYCEWMFVVGMILIYIPYFVWLVLSIFTNMDVKEMLDYQKRAYDNILYAVEMNKLRNCCGEEDVSYWVGFKVKVEGMDKYIELDSFNYTCNLGMAMRVASGTEKGIVELHQKKAEECLPILNKMIDEFTKHPDKYKQYEPANGWGSLQTCLTFLHKLKSKCEEYPVAIVEVDY